MKIRPSTEEYEAALAEERVLWTQLQQPVTDVNEGVKAFACWSAAAERARSIYHRTHDQEAGEPQARAEAFATRH